MIDFVDSLLRMPVLGITALFCQDMTASEVLRRNKRLDVSSCILYWDLILSAKSLGSGEWLLSEERLGTESLSIMRF